MKQINGDLSHGIFHQKPDLTVISNEVSLKEYLEKGLEINLSPIKFSSELKINTESKQTDLNFNPTEKNLKESDKVKTANDDGSNHKAVSVNEDSNKKITNTDIEYLKKHSRLYLGSYNYINSKLYYIISDVDRREVKSKKTIDLLNGYIPLRNEYVIFYDNLINKRLDENQIKKDYQNIDYMLDMFHFQYGYLKSFQIELQDDFYFDKIHSVLEKINPQRISQQNKYIKNDNFNVDFFLQYKKDETQSIENTQEIKIKNSQDTESINPGPNELISKDVFTPFEVIEKPNFDKEDELKKNIYKYYDYYGVIDLEFISKLYQVSPEEILQKGFDEKIIYINPILDEDNNFLHFKTDLFFLGESGHIENKINAFQKEKLPYEINTEQICNYLTSIKNEKLDIADIEFNFESFFIPIEAKNSFFKELVNENIRPLFQQFEQNITLSFEKEYNPIAHEMYSVRVENTKSTEEKVNSIKAEYGYKKLFQDFVENVYPVVYYTAEEGDNKVRKIDTTATIVAQNKYEQLQLEFKSFIQNNIKYKEITEENYYNYFLAEKEIDIKDTVLSYPNTLVHKPYDHQLTSVLYGLNRGTALYDHKVGHGKSVAMGLLADKLVKHKKAERVLLITTKAVSAQLFKELQTNFPNLNMFLLNERNFNAKKRESTLNYLKNSNIQLIVGEHTYIQNMPKSENDIRTVFANKLYMIEQDLEAALAFGGKVSKQIVKGLEKRKDTLANKLNTTLDKLSKKQSLITFDDLKIDALLVDEAHEFKNIQYTTRHERVAGLNSSAETTKNLDMELSIFSIHQRKGKDKNVFFYSGTPIKNSVTEVYAYQRYLTPYDLAKKNINNFDSWASIFLKQSVQAESDIFGQARMHKRFRYYTNMPELSKMYRSFTHISDEKTFKTHNVTINSVFRDLETTPGYEELKEASILFTQKNNQDALFGYDKYDEKSMKAAHVTALTINRKCLIDPFLTNDLIIPFDEEDQIKLNVAAKDAYDLYKISEKDKGVVLIFSDIGVWKPNKYNSYDTIKNILHTKYDIPLHEIGIAQENKKKFDSFQEKIRNGDIRIAIGSTKTLGTGTNIQNRVIGVVEVDIPYAPDASEQRLGRMGRAGNWISEKYPGIKNHFGYGFKDTTDIFSTSLNKHKAFFISQIKEINHKNRIFDDVFTEATELSYGQREALLIGDMNAFKLVKLEDDLKALKAQKTMFDIGKNNAAKKIEIFEQTNKEILKDIVQLKNTHKSLIAYVPDIKEEDKAKDIEIKSVDKLNNLFFPDFATNKFNVFQEINDFLIRKITDLNAMNIGEHKLHKFYNHNVYLTMISKNVLNKTSHSFNLNLADSNITIYGSSQYKFDNTKLAYQVFKLIKKIPEVIKMKENDFDYNLRTIESNKKNSISEFPENKLKEIESIDKEIKKIKRIKP